MTKEGKYTKFKGENNTVLAFVAKSEKDNYHAIMEIVKNGINADINRFQCCETQEEQNNFENVLYVLYDSYGTMKKDVLLQFDFDNETMTIKGEKPLKIIEDKGYTYKFQKSQIKAKNGIQGFYNFIIECINDDSAFHSELFHLINKS